MATAKETFVLIGPHAGKDLIVNNHEFVDGEFTFHGSAEQIVTLTNIFDFYGAVPAGKAREMALEARLAALQAQQASTVQEVLQAAATPAGQAALQAAAVQAETAATAAPASTESSSAGASGTVNATLSLGEAIGALDPETDSDWTSNNLPSLDRLADLVGKKPSRDEVEAIATGYTRAKARAARA